MDEIEINLAFIAYFGDCNQNLDFRHMSLARLVEIDTWVEKTFKPAIEIKCYPGTTVNCLFDQVLADYKAKKMDAAEPVETENNLQEDSVSLKTFELEFHYGNGVTLFRIVKAVDEDEITEEIKLSKDNYAWLCWKAGKETFNISMAGLLAFRVSEVDEN